MSDNPPSPPGSPPGLPADPDAPVPVEEPPAAIPVPGEPEHTPLRLRAGCP